MSNLKQNLDPEQWQHLIKIVIALLSAIAGAIGASSAHAMGLLP